MVVSETDSRERSHREVSVDEDASCATDVGQGPFVAVVNERFNVVSDPVERHQLMCLVLLLRLILNLVVKLRENEPVLADVVGDEEDAQELPNDLEAVDDEDLLVVVYVVLVLVLA